MISVAELNKNYGDVRALSSLSLEVGDGRLFGLLGPNGAGKTTLIKLLCGNARPDGGRASICGVDVFARPVEVKSLIGVVHQANSLDIELTVWENLEIHGLLHRMPFARRRKRAEEILELTELKGKRNVQARKLSGGMKRRLMIGRALMHEPKVLFLDEPTVGLDPSIRRKIWALIRGIRESGTTVLLTTHYIEEAEFLCESVAFIDDGRIVQTDTPANFIKLLGKWAVDVLDGNELVSSYFDRRDAAEEFVAGRTEPVSMRRVNLEDVFLNLTGRKIVGFTPVPDGNGEGGGHSHQSPE